MTVAQAKTLLALTKSDVGLGNVDNTADTAKPVSAAQQTALNAKADKTTTISTTAPLTGGGDLTANRTLDISTFTATVKGAVPPPTTATGKYLKDDGTWAVPAGSGTVRKFSAACAAALSTVVNHAFNTRDVVVNVYRLTTPWDTVDADVERTDVNNVTVRFTTAPAAGAYQIVVLG
jgi:hypothetical protein